MVRVVLGSGEGGHRPNCLPTWPLPFCTPPQRMSPCGSTPSPPFGVVSVLDFGHSHRHAVVSRFILHVPDDIRWGASFHVFVICIPSSVKCLLNLWPIWCVFLKTSTKGDWDPADPWPSLWETSYCNHRTRRWDELKASHWVEVQPRIYERGIQPCTWSQAHTQESLKNLATFYWQICSWEPALPQIFTFWSFGAWGYLFFNNYNGTAT